jgi:hypothetical protein
VLVRIESVKIGTANTTESLTMETIATKPVIDLSNRVLFTTQHNFFGSVGASLAVVS